TKHGLGTRVGSKLKKVLLFMVTRISFDKKY
ncbi:MAG: hypothetical protein ACJAR6_000703, partial [Oleispira sp.]